MTINAQAYTESLSVFDINGRRILYQRGANHQSFDTSSLPNGVYFCRIVTLEGNVENIKFIVNH
jgi:late competence protein required for DNA uptake (superfamily II DNA/RNA helicase)